MYRIRLYIVPEQEEALECRNPNVVLDRDQGQFDECWWTEENNRMPILQKRRGSTQESKQEKRNARNNRENNKKEEYDLEQKIELEIKMREGTTRLLAACKHQAQTLEAAKTLLTSTERMSAYMAELQRRKKQQAVPRSITSTPSASAGVARVSLSDLRVPLMWRDSDHFKNKGDYRRFAVFCLARIGTEIYDTSLLCPVDRSLTDLTFPDVVLFNNIPAEFEFRLEVYSHVLQDDLSIASTPRKIKRTIHSSISRTVGKKLAASLKDELNSGRVGPHFELMASARLTLEDADEGTRTHDLLTVTPGQGNKQQQLPLFGHFCCRLAVQPEHWHRELIAGDLLACTSPNTDQFRPMYAQLQGWRLRMWDRREQCDLGQPAAVSLTVDRESAVRVCKGRDVHVTHSGEDGERATVLRLRTREEQQQWARALASHAQEHLRWGRTALQPVELATARLSRMALRQGSLYDETPLIGDYQRPSVQQLFGLTPSTSLSSCASSSGSPTFRERSFSGGNKRSHWPFASRD